MMKKNLNTKSQQYTNNVEFKRKRGRPSKKELDFDLDCSTELDDETLDNDTLIPSEHTEEPVYELDDIVDDVDDDDVDDVDDTDDKVDITPIKKIPNEKIVKTIEKPLTLKEKKIKYYVDTDKLEKDILYYNNTGIITDELALSLSNIAHRVAYMPNFINYCVDKDTEALTQRGWLKYNEITIQDKILSYDILKKHLTWSNIKNIFINKYEGKMHSLNIRGMNALVTPNHKFVTLEDGLKKVEHLKSDDHVVLMGDPLPTDENIKKWSDDFVELVGWAVTEGNYLLGKRTHSVQIFQKIGLKATRIQNCLERLKIEYKIYNWTNPNMLGFRFNKEFANLIVKVAPKKVLSMDFILSLTQSQRLLLIQTMCDGDGWTHMESNGGLTRGYSQKDKNHIDTFIALCTLAGLTTKTVYIKNTSKFGYGSYYYNVNIYINPKKVCLVENIDFNGGKPRPGGDQKSLMKKGKQERVNNPTIDYNDIIWCPETEYGTFICRRGKYVYITGNTWKEEMIGDGLIKEFLALKNKKYDPKRGRAFSYFTMIVYHSFCNRIKKENKANEVLKDYQNEEYDKLMFEYGLQNGTINTSEHNDEEDC